MAGFRSASTAILATVLVGAVNVAATVISLFLLDRLGRRRLLLISIAGMGLAWSISGTCFGASTFRTAIIIDVIAYLASFAVD